MATDREDCIDRLVKASGGKVSRAEAEAALDALLRKAEARGPSWKPMEERLAETARAMEDDLIERATIARRNIRNDAIKAIKLQKDIARAPTLVMGLEAKLGGVNVAFEGSRLSVDSGFKGRRRDLFGHFGSELEAAGVEKLFLSRALQTEWATELYELNRGEYGKPGITGSKDALAIATAISNAQKRSIDMINAEGGWVKSYSGYVARTSHDPDRIRRMGKDAWLDLTLAHIDVRRTFGDADLNQARFDLQKMYPQFVNGDHLDYSRPFDDSWSIVDVDFASRASQNRELHFKSAADWLAYNAAAGRFNPTDAVVHAFENAAKLSSLMQVFGSQPRKGMDEILHHIRAKTADDVDGRAAFDKYENRVNNLFAQFDGTAGRPVNRTLATIGSNIRAVTRMSKLGLTPFAMLSDLATKSSELRYQGMNFAERHGSTIEDYFKGEATSEKRQVATLLGHALDSEIGSLAQRFDSESPASALLARAEQKFFRWTGIQAMTFNQRHGAERIMAAHFGEKRGATFADLGADEARILRAFEIGRPEWELLHKVEWNDIQGTTYFTPDIATRLSDADVKAYLVRSGRLHKDATGPTVEFNITKTRDDLAHKLAAYFADRGEYAVLEPGARERAILYGGAARDWAPGTVKGEAWRLFLQFKQFPATMLTKTWGREIHGGKTGMDRMAGLLELIAYGTVLGITANGLTQFVKGQDPFSKWRNEPASAMLAGFIRGGVASIYGDFLLGQFNRFGLPASATVLGPTFGQIDRLAELYSDIVHPTATGGVANKPASAGTLALRIGRDNLPFMNMIYTKAIFDYAIYYKLSEWMNPGYLERYERTMKDKQGIEFWLKPSRVSR